jgi:hypothetical protein
MTGASMEPSLSCWTSDVKGEVIDPRILPGTLVTLNQRIKHVPFAVRNMPAFDIRNTTVPVWDTAGRNYEYVPSGSVATVIRRYGIRPV